MNQQEEHTPDPDPTVEELYAIYEREAREGFPDRGPTRTTPEDCWLSDADLERPDDLVSLPKEADDAAVLVGRMQRGEQRRAFLIRRHRDGSTDHHQAVASDPNLHRFIDAGWVGD